MKTIFLTGATGSLGHAVAARLTRDYRCIALYRSESSWISLRNAVQGDIRGVKDAAAEVNEALYGVVLLAGAFAPGSAVADFQNMFEANLFSAVRAVESLRERIEEGGRIVAISSAASLSTPAGLGAYVASKSALNAWLDVLAKEMKKQRITVNAILPTALDTAKERETMPAEKLVPLEEVAEAIAFLLRPEAASITGQRIVLSR